MNLKLVKIASVREHMDAHYRDEISYSKAVDLINKDACKQLMLIALSNIKKNKVMSNDNLSSKEPSRELNKAVVVSRIHLISGLAMQTELFEKLREELADTMIETMGFEHISKLAFFMPGGKYWQLQYGL
jgi:hypothetical protein